MVRRPPRRGVRTLPYALQGAPSGVRLARFPCWKDRESLCVAGVASWFTQSGAVDTGEAEGGMG